MRVTASRENRGSLKGNLRAFAHIACKAAVSKVLLEVPAALGQRYYVINGRETWGRPDCFTRERRATVGALSDAVEPKPVVVNFSMAGVGLKRPSPKRVLSQLAAIVAPPLRN